MALLAGCSLAHAQPNKILYELQERCGKQAAQKFQQEYGTGSETVSGTEFIYNYRNHYNASLNKCFYATISNATISAKGKTAIVRTLELLDLNENNRYGIYIGERGDRKPPTMCEVRFKECKSEIEWWELASAYMED